MKRKVLLALMVITLSILVFGVINVSATEIVNTGTYGTNLTWTFDNEGTLTINGSGNMPDSAAYSVPWRDYWKEIKKVVIDNRVTNIGYMAFNWCDNLTSITIPDGVTSIGSFAFRGCKSLTNINIPDGVRNIGKQAFSGCTNLTEIDIDEITTIGEQAFSDCTSLKEIIIGNGITTIEKEVFSGCTELKTVTIGNSVKTINSTAFQQCDRLINISVSGSNQKFSSLDGNLYNKDKTVLLQYAIGKSESTFKIPSSVTSIGSLAFLNSKLSTVTIPNSVTSIGESAFRYSENLTAINIPNGVMSIGNWAFQGCFNLGSVTIPHSITSIGNGSFYMCTVKNIYYNGTQEDWKKIQIGYSNDTLNNATKKFFFYVTILDAKGKEISNLMCDVNSVIEISEFEEKYEHTIHLYSDNEYQSEYDLTTPIIENLVLHLRYVPNQYPSKFIDYNGDLIWEGLIDYGAIITAPENPERDRTQQYTYDFVCWDGFEEGITQTNQEMVFTATYNAIVNQYTYKFLDEDGSVLKQSTVDYGTVIEPSVDPAKENTAQYTYTFAGWNGYTLGMTLEDDIEFTATYNETINQYTYKFLDDNGDVLKEETVDYGTTIVAPENPVDKDAYTFDCWEGFSDGMTVDGDIAFKAVYKYKVYNVSVFGYEDLKSEVIYNRNYTITPAEKYGYEFLGYYSEEKGTGTKLTDENGNSIAVYNIEDNLVVYPYFKDLLCNKVVVSGADKVTIGDTGIRYTVSLGTDKKDIYYTTIMVKYPKAFILEEVIKNKFDETQIVEITESNDYNIAEILCIYSYDGNDIPTLTPIDAFELCFDVDKTAKEQDVTVEITNGSILMGEAEDYSFDGFVNASVSIEPKLTESISIDGLSQIDAPTQYTATVYPDYTTDKAVVWSVSDENIATISEDGVLTPVKNGTVTITATANDGSEVFATKTVDVIAYAQITSLDFGSGVVLAGFNPNVRNYTVYVKDNASSIILTPKYSKGTLKADSDISLLSGRAKEFELNDVITTITLNRENVTDMTDSVYTIEVIKFEGTKTEVSEDKKSFAITPINVENGKTVILALYDGDKFVEMQSALYNGEPIPFTTTKSYTNAKIMVWDSLTNIKPVCDVEIVK